MSFIVTSEFELNRVAAPNLPRAPMQYSAHHQEQYSNVLRLYFNRLNNILGQLMATTSTLPVSIGGTNVDAFGRLRVSQPYTLFDSQNRYAADNQFDTAYSGGGGATYSANESAVYLTVDTSSGSKSVRQTYRNMLYQPGKGLLVLATFVMNAAQTGLRQRVGYFGTSNGVFLQQADSTVSFVLRSSTSGSPSDARTVDQADWNGDRMDGTGPSGYILDVTKSQILWMDFEWLGMGNVRCGFIIDGEYIVCHTFQTAGLYNTVYMTTAILPVRYEIENTAATADNAALMQVCSSVMSEGGFEATSLEHVARRTSIFTNIDTASTFYPIVSIRLASTALGAVVLPQKIQFLPTTSQNYEVVLMKNPTLTGASWTAFSGDANVQYDVSATAISAAGTIVQSAYIASSGGGGQSSTDTPSGFNWDEQLGVSLGGVSDIYTLGVRTISGATKGDGVGSISFYDLTQ